MKKTAAASIIDKNNTTAEYTRPEIAFDKIYENRVTKPLPIEVKTNLGIVAGLYPNEKSKIWSLAVDRQFIGTNILIQIDGVYHRTRRQERKSQWEDEALNEKGFRVLHIDSELLTVKKYHAYVMAEVQKFLTGKEARRRLAA